MVLCIERRTFGLRSSSLTADDSALLSGFGGAAAALAAGAAVSPPMNASPAVLEPGSDACSEA